MSQPTGVDHTGKCCCRSTHTPQAGFARCAAALVWSQRETSPGQDGGKVWGNLCLPAHLVEAAELPHVEGMCVSYTPYARAC